MLSFIDFSATGLQSMDFFGCISAKLMQFLAAKETRGVKDHCFPTSPILTELGYMDFEICISAKLNQLDSSWWMHRGI